MNQNKNISINKLIGLRVRNYRRFRDITLKELAIIVGVSSQQLQKYESGRNRISAEMLVRVCSALKICPTIIVTNLHDNIYDKELDYEVLKLIKYFNKINSEELKNLILTAGKVYSKIS